MNKFRGLLSKQRDSGASSADSKSSSADSPELNAPRAVRLFCESGAPSNTGEEVLHLPVIVDAAESGPVAAGAAASQIRTFLGKDYFEQSHVQYNAIMLIRILANNPGKNFTKHLDSKFSNTVKELLRQSRDPSVQQIIRETLDALESEKAYDDNLISLMAMWRKEKGAPEKGSYAAYQTAQTRNFAQLNTRLNSGQQTGSASRTKQPPSALPPPQELAGRVEEGRTTAKLLIQLIQSTPPAEVVHSDLVKEFSQRCQAAQRSLQEYMNCTNPSPDPDTLQTLIETCEQLSLATSKHQRAVLQVRRAQGGPSPELSASNPTNGQRTYSQVQFATSPPTAPGARSPPPQVSPMLPAASVGSVTRQGQAQQHDPFLDPATDDAENHVSSPTTTQLQSRSVTSPPKTLVDELSPSSQHPTSTATAETFAAPSGPPPTSLSQRKPLAASTEQAPHADLYSDDDHDLYNTSPTTPRLPSANGPSNPQDQTTLASSTDQPPAPTQNTSYMPYNPTAQRQPPPVPQTQPGPPPISEPTWSNLPQRDSYSAHQDVSAANVTMTGASPLPPGSGAEPQAVQEGKSSSRAFGQRMSGWRRKFDS